MCCGLCFDAFGFVVYTVKKRIANRVKCLQQWCSETRLGKSLQSWRKPKEKEWWHFDSDKESESDPLERRKTLWPFDKEELLPLKPKQRDLFNMDFWKEQPQPPQQQQQQQSLFFRKIWPFDASHRSTVGKTTR